MNRLALAAAVALSVGGAYAFAPEPTTTQTDSMRALQEAQGACRQLNSTMNPDHRLALAQIILHLREQYQGDMPDDLYRCWVEARQIIGLPDLTATSSSPT